MSVLLQLRQELESLGGRGWYLPEDCPTLYGLAKALDGAPRRARHVTFRGVRFPVMHGFRRYALDPETGATVCGGRFLV